MALGPKFAKLCDNLLLKKSRESGEKARKRGKARGKKAKKKSVKTERKKQGKICDFKFDLCIVLHKTSSFCYIYGEICRIFDPVLHALATFFVFNSVRMLAFFSFEHFLQSFPPANFCRFFFW
jgi:hypothetical protein